MITNDTRREKLREVSENIVEIYGSLETGDLLKDVRARNNISNDAFIDVVGDVILGLIPQEKFADTLIKELGLDPETVKQAEVELKGLFSKIGDDTGAQRVGEVVVPTDPPISNINPKKPLTREEVMQALNSQRTVGNDVEKMNSQ